ncbi:MAG: glycosyltransferase [Candidatus Saccharibacteria bacterium]
MKNKISIIIPCKDDRRIIESIKSIDYKRVEVVIVFNGAVDSFVDYVKSELINSKLDIEIYQLPKPNLALALELGTQKSKNDLVLYMDSDCRFKKDAISRFVKVASEHDNSNNVFKGEVIFEKSDKWIEQIISESRAHHTAEVLTAYKPPLMISKKILTKIGGYAFNEKLIWREDSDLDNRIRCAGISILPVAGGTIYHHTISLKTDLRSTFRYGIGLAIANSMHIKLTEVPRSTLSSFISKGLVVSLYMLFRNRVYDAGYVYTRIKILFGRYA